MEITLLCDNQESWIIPYLRRLNDFLNANDTIDSILVENLEEVNKRDILFILSCENILDDKDLDKHKNNLVIHESDLPQGKGWSPLTWQILEGKKQIPITLFEASSKVDYGDIYYKDFISLEGHELIDEIKYKQWDKTKKLILKFIDKYPNNSSYKQTGNSTYYLKRSPKNSQIDIDKTINEQFDLLRVVDNNRYPAFFLKEGYKYLLYIEKEFDCEIIYFGNYDNIIFSQNFANIKYFVFERGKESKVIIDHLNEDQEYFIINKIDDVLKIFCNKDFDLVIVGSFGKIFKKKHINFFDKKIINIHPGLLPEYRGRHPLPQAILNKEKMMGITAHILTSKIDCGEIIETKKLKINFEDSYKSNEKRLFSFVPEIFDNIVKMFNINEIPFYNNQFYEIGNYYKPLQKEILLEVLNSDKLRSVLDEKNCN